jgi:hypothetical protein
MGRLFASPSSSHKTKKEKEKSKELKALDHWGKDDLSEMTVIGGKSLRSRKSKEKSSTLSDSVPQSAPFNQEIDTTIRAATASNEFEFDVTNPFRTELTSTSLSHQEDQDTIQTQSASNETLAPKTPPTEPSLTDAQASGAIPKRYETNLPPPPIPDRKVEFDLSKQTTTRKPPLAPKPPTPSTLKLPKPPTPPPRQQNNTLMENMTTPLQTILKSQTRIRSNPLDEEQLDGCFDTEVKPINKSIRFEENPEEDQLLMETPVPASENILTPTRLNSHIEPNPHHRFPSPAQDEFFTPAAELPTFTRRSRPSSHRSTPHATGYNRESKCFNRSIIVKRLQLGPQYNRRHTIDRGNFPNMPG